MEIIAARARRKEIQISDKRINKWHLYFGALALLVIHHCDGSRTAQSRSCVRLRDPQRSAQPASLSRRLSRRLPPGGLGLLSPRPWTSPE